MSDKTFLDQIIALETQLAVLKAQVEKLSTPTAPHLFADLYGNLSGKVDLMEEEIDAMQYRFGWEGQRKSPSSMLDTALILL